MQLSNDPSIPASGKTPIVDVPPQVLDDIFATCLRPLLLVELRRERFTDLFASKRPKVSRLSAILFKKTLSRNAELMHCTEFMCFAVGSQNEHKYLFAHGRWDRQFALLLMRCLNLTHLVLQVGPSLEHTKQAMKGLTKFIHFGFKSNFKRPFDINLLLEDMTTFCRLPVDGIPLCLRPIPYDCTRFPASGYSKRPIMAFEQR
jgi:hypothetical protein